MFKIHKIEARDLPDLWFQAVHDVLDVGKRFKIDRGSYAGQTRLEYDFFIGHVRQPWHGSGTPEILPDIPPSVGIPNPVEFEYVYGGEGYTRSYVEYVMTDTKMPNESYTYGERLVKAKFHDIFKWNLEQRKEIFLQDKELQQNGIISYFETDILIINQIELIIWTYKNKGYRNNQMVLQVAQPSDCFLQDPPCLRQIDTRIQDNKLHFIVYFRSWDLWGGLPANLAGIQALQQYMADSIGVKHGEMIVESKGLHLYGYAEDLAKMRCMKDCK
jgi:thymidylate synthase